MKKLVVLVLMVLCLAGLAGCGQSGTRKLSREEIDRANAAFSDIVWDEEQGTMVTNGLSRFFTSHYADPRDLNLMEFLWNCPVGTTLSDEDAEKFQKVLAQSGSKMLCELPSDYIVPTHRYRREDVSELLQKYAGITADELTSWDHVIYLEEYDAFYNFTSDYSPGCFTCTGGKVQGDTVRLWSETEELVLKHVDGTYLIQSFMEMTD